MKKCGRCEIEKDLFYFHKNKYGKDGLNSICKNCRKKYRSINKESILNRQKQWRENHKDYNKQYYQDNIEYFQLHNKQYKKDNPEYFKQWKKDNTNKNRQYINYRRAMKKNQIGFISNNIVEILLDKQNKLCNYCQVILEKYHLDHIYPLSKGGLHDDDNLQLLCPSCNMKKGSKIINIDK